MTTAYTKHTSPQAHIMGKRKRKHEELPESTLEKINEDIKPEETLFISLPSKAICEALDVKPEVIVTILAQGEQYTKEKGQEYYKFHNLLPETCTIRFFKDDMETLKVNDPLFEAIEKVGRKHGGIYKFRLLDLAEEMQISPLEVPRQLFRRQCQGIITYEAETDCFCLEICLITKNIEWLTKKIVEHMWKVENNTLSKLYATYILCRQASYPTVDFILKQEKMNNEQEQIEKSSSLIHNLNNMYFNSLEGIYLFNNINRGV